MILSAIQFIQLSHCVRCDTCKSVHDCVHQFAEGLDVFAIETPERGGIVERRHLDLEQTQVSALARTNRHNATDVLGSAVPNSNEGWKSTNSHRKGNEEQVKLTGFEARELYASRNTLDLQSSIVQDKCSLLVECVCELGAVIAKAELAQFWTAALR